MTYYIPFPLSVSDKEAFTEASLEELRVLILLIEAKEEKISAEAIAKRAKISRARVSSAIAFWKESGIIQDYSDSSPTITEEFEQRLEKGGIEEVDSKTVANSIRRDSLADMISECAILMGRATLNTAEIKQLTALHQQYNLSEEYILTLSSYLAERGRFTITKLINKAISLSERDIDTPKALEAYIIEMESESEAEREFRKIFGIYGRAPGKTEKELFRKWSKDYGYFTDVVGEAYDIAVTSVNRGHIKYADKLITRWFETGCRTLAECKKRYSEDEQEKKKAKDSFQKKTQPKKEAKKRYGDFDANEAFMKALERSYGPARQDEND